MKRRKSYCYSFLVSIIFLTFNGVFKGFICLYEICFPVNITMLIEFQR